jgi:hypothetical protein
MIFPPIGGCRDLNKINGYGNIVKKRGDGAREKKSDIWLEI